MLWDDAGAALRPPNGLPRVAGPRHGGALAFVTGWPAHLRLRQEIFGLMGKRSKTDTSLDQAEAQHGQAADGGVRDQA